MELMSPGRFQGEEKKNMNAFLRIKNVMLLNNKNSDLKKAIFSISGNSFTNFTVHHLSTSGQTKKISYILVDIVGQLILFSSTQMRKYYFIR